MRTFFCKPFRWAAVFSAVLVLSVTLVLLDTFVIPHEGRPINYIKAPWNTDTDDTDNESGTDTEGTTPSKPVFTKDSYKDDNIQITIKTIRKYDTDIYVADIRLSDVSYLKAAFAKGKYGRNIKEFTSDIAKENNAIFAINGDFYGFRGYGFVLRNGVLYRDTAYTDEALAIDSHGNLSIIDETKTNAQSLADSGMWQVFSFGPALIVDGKINVTAKSEVKQCRTSNPRTAIGQVSELHYIIIVSDGRTKKSAGLTLLELAGIFKDYGCDVAYNLDGGGSSTMWFNGKIVNIPTNDGKTIVERSVSDIVYIGY